MSAGGDGSEGDNSDVDAEGYNNGGVDVMIVAVVEADGDDISGSDEWW